MSNNWKKKYLKNRSYYLNVAAQYSKRADIKAYLEILLSLATVIVFAIFALRPTLITIAELIKEIDSKKDTVQKMDDKIQKLAKAQSLFDQQRPNILLLSAAMPDSASPDSFIRQVEGLSIKHQSSISDLTVGSSTILGAQSKEKELKEQDISPVPEGAGTLDFSVTAVVNINDYSAIYNLLKDLEKLRRPIKFDSLKIDVSSKEEIKSLNMNVSGRLPYLKDLQ